MTKFTKEQLIEWAQKHKNRAEEYLAAVPNDEFGLKDLALVEIALAALKAEPVAMTEKHEISNMEATGLYLRAWPTDRSQNEREGYTIPLYRLPLLEGLK